MGQIYRLIVNNNGEEQNAVISGKIAFINAPLKKSIHIGSLPKWRFRTSKYKKKIDQLNIKCVNWFEYCWQNIFYYLILFNFEKHDCLFLGLAGFSSSSAIDTKQFLLELKPHLGEKKIIIVIEKEWEDGIEIFSEFPIYNANVAE